MSQEMIKKLFEQFWQAGMRKSAKKSALRAFTRIITKESDPQQFTINLIEDIQKRLQGHQFGFTQTLPASYLNGERWEDELPTSSQMPQVISNTPQTTRSRTLEEDFNDYSWARGYGSH